MITMKYSTKFSEQNTIVTTFQGIPDYDAADNLHDAMWGYFIDDVESLCFSEFSEDRETICEISVEGEQVHIGNLSEIYKKLEKRQEKRRMVERTPEEYERLIEIYNSVIRNLIVSAISNKGSVPICLRYDLVKTLPCPQLLSIFEGYQKIGVDEISVEILSISETTAYLEVNKCEFATVNLSEIIHILDKFQLA